MEIKVIIVEDDSEIRNGLTQLINNASGYKCIASFSDAVSFLEKNDELDADVVLMDINLPYMSGIDCIKKLRKKNFKLNVIILSIYEDDDNIFEALKSGAQGYLLKKTPVDEILKSIKDVIKGGSPMTGQIARRVVQSFHQKPSEFEKLSEREQEILVMLSKGYRYKDIGDKMFISIETVRTHIRNIYEKLQVHSRTEALLKAFPH